jgi:hypothetical protein
MGGAGVKRSQNLFCRVLVIFIVTEIWHWEVLKKFFLLPSRLGIRWFVLFFSAK